MRHIPRVALCCQHDLALNLFQCHVQTLLERYPGRYHKKRRG
jgi:hypothetical protein